MPEGDFENNMRDIPLTRWRVMILPCLSIIRKRLFKGWLPCPQINHFLQLSRKVESPTLRELYFNGHNQRWKSLVNVFFFFLLNENKYLSKQGNKRCHRNVAGNTHQWCSLVPSLLSQSTNSFSSICMCMLKRLCDLYDGWKILAMSLHQILIEAWQICCWDSRNVLIGLWRTFWISNTCFWVALVLQWWSRVGKDDERMGRPITGKMPENVGRFRKIIHEGIRSIIHHHSHTIGMSYEVSVDSSLETFRYHLVYYLII